MRAGLCSFRLLFFFEPIRVINLAKTFILASDRLVYRIARVFVFVGNENVVLCADQLHQAEAFWRLSDNFTYSNVNIPAKEEFKAL